MFLEVGNAILVSTFVEAVKDDSFRKKVLTIYDNESGSGDTYYVPVDVRQNKEALREKVDNEM